MCGIAGAASTRIAQPEVVAAMTSALRHRGPDDEGTWGSQDGRCVLGHRRLSIIDLSPGGHQPMSTEDGRICLTFNGEIYNHRALRRELEAKGFAFRSSSDTEVLLRSYQAWGEGCPEHLDGMFAFGIFDGRAGRLMLARDRAGEKPLYYRLSGGTLSFASELQALMQDPSLPRRISARALDSYLAYGYVPAERCLVDGVAKLPAASVLTFDATTGETRLSRYWALPDPCLEATPKEDLAGELEGLLCDSLALRLEADVPVGILLSGGLDSSLLTWAAAKASSRPVRTFTISFPGHGSLDESKHARLVAEHFGTEHHEMAAGEDDSALLAGLGESFDEPLADPSLIPTFMVCQLIRREAKVAVGGDGGDELFGGYLHYTRVVAEDRLRRAAGGLLGPAARIAERIAPGVHGRSFAVSLGLPRDQAPAGTGWIFDPFTRSRLLGREANPEERGSPEAWKTSLAPSNVNPVERAMRTDFLSYLSGDILTKVDRASMRTSLEMRAPWLDHKIIEFAFGRVPPQMKVSAGARKILPRMLGERVLPPGFDFERKQGFQPPTAAWLKGPFGEQVRSLLLSPRQDLFERSYVERLLDGQRRGRSNSTRIFCLAMFELWRTQHGVSL